MLKLLIYRFFYTLQKSYDNIDKLLPLLTNKEILKELFLQNEYKMKIRKALNYTINGEKYKVENIHIKKEGSIARANISLIHSFNYNTNGNALTSSERLYFILILKKFKISWRIVDICNRDLFPITYERLKKKSLFSNISTPIDMQNRITFLEEQLSSLNSFIINFKGITSSPQLPMQIRAKLYDKEAAVQYAQRYALNYNTKYKNFNDNGGDCTNYVSQCINAGGIPTSNSWKPYSNSWLRVNELYYYLTRRGIGIDITSKNLYKEGCIIQFYANIKGYFSHSGVITKVLPNGEYLYCCHSYDKLNFPLSEIFPFMYDKIRVIQLL